MCSCNDPNQPISSRITQGPYIVHTGRCVRGTCPSKATQLGPIIDPGVSTIASLSTTVIASTHSLAPATTTVVTLCPVQKISTKGEKPRKCRLTPSHVIACRLMSLHVVSCRLITSTVRLAPRMNALCRIPRKTSGRCVCRFCLMKALNSSLPPGMTCACQRQPTTASGTNATRTRQRRHTN